MWEDPDDGIHIRLTEAIVRWVVDAAEGWQAAKLSETWALELHCVLDDDPEEWFAEPNFNPRETAAVEFARDLT